MSSFEELLKNRGHEVGRNVDKPLVSKYERQANGSTIDLLQADKAASTLSEAFQSLERVTGSLESDVRSVRFVMSLIKGLVDDPQALIIEESIGQFEDRLLRVFGKYVVNLLTDETTSIQERILQSKALLEEYLPVAVDEEVENFSQKDSYIDPIYSGDDIDFSDMLDEVSIEENLYMI